MKFGLGGHVLDVGRRELRRGGARVEITLAKLKTDLAVGCDLKAGEAHFLVASHMRRRLIVTRRSCQEASQ